METTYIIKLHSTRPSRNFLHSVCKNRITRTRHLQFARSFQSVEEAQALIDQIQYQIRWMMSVETYMVPTKEAAQ